MVAKFPSLCNIQTKILQICYNWLSLFIYELNKDLDFIHVKSFSIEIM